MSVAAAFPSSLSPLLFPTLTPSPSSPLFPFQFVREKSYAYFMKLENVMDPANNSSQYRNVLARVGRKEPCIPFFG